MQRIEVFSSGMGEFASSNDFAQRIPTSARLSTPALNFAKELHFSEWTGGRSTELEWWLREGNNTKRHTFQFGPAVS